MRTYLIDDLHYSVPPSLFLSGYILKLHTEKGVEWVDYEEKEEKRSKLGSVGESRRYETTYIFIYKK